MRKITMITLILSFGIVGSLFAQTNHWVESFENPLDSWSGYTTGTINFQESGAWDFVSVYPESSSGSWDGSKACRINDDIAGASITSPAVNSLGKVSFYYHRPYGGTGTFQLQVSLDGGAYTTLDNVNFDAVTTPTYYEYDVNNVSNNIKVRIVNDDNTAHLTIDYVTLTDYSGGATPFISVSPASLSGFSYVFGFGPSTSQSFTVEGIDLTADIDVAPSTNYEISLDDATFTLSPITLTQSGGTVTSTTIYARLKAGLAGGNYNEDITCSSTGATDKTVSCSGTVEAPATTTLPYNETFDTDLGDCYIYSVSGATKEWAHGAFGGNGYAELNGYNSGDTEEDWLILPGIDFDSYTGELMTFDTWNNFGTNDANNYLKLYYSSNYPGIGDPSSYTWTEIAFTQGGTNAWTNSGNIDLSAITGTAVYIAFEYHYEPGSYKHWEVDNISIVPSVPVDVTFQVNMNDETVSGNGVHVAGSFQGWDPATTEMLDPDLDGIYTVTLTLNSNIEYQFKYINGNAWADNEVVPSGCQIGGNRYEYVTDPDYSIPVVCFGSCVDCGGAWFDITFQVDMQNETVSGDGAYLAGSFTSWGSGAIAMTQNGTIWSTTVSLQENSPEEYKFINGDPNNGGTWEFVANRQITIPSANTIIDVDCFNSYDACPVSDFVIINEVDVDQSGTDTQEFIELFDGGVGNTNLSGLVVVLYNGNGDVSYRAEDLDGYSTDANGYFLLGNAAVVPTPSIIFPNNTLQNGADAISLYVGNDTDFPNGTLVTITNLLDAIVYDTNDGDDSGLLVLLNPGEPQVNEGGRGSSATHSNQRLPNGSGGQRNTSTYDQAIPTPGAVNAASFTDWTGNSTSDWFDAASWSNGLPTAPINAVVTDMTPSGNPNPIINGSGAVVNDLVVQSLGELTIGSAGQLTVNGLLSNQNGAAGIVLQSDATGQGSLLTNDVTYMTVQTYLTQGQWHGVTAPVSGDTAGVFLGVYLADYTESDSSWAYIVPENTPLPLGQGYLAWAVSDFTANHVGVINVSDLSSNLSYTDPHPHPLGQGWNLVGNPFTSAVTWNTNWTLTNLDATMYIYDGTQYKTMNTDGITGTLPSADIPIGQGLWVRANATNPSITIPASERLHSGQGFYKNENSNLHFAIEGNAYLDEMIVQFNDNASAGFDSQYDAYKLRGIEAAPQLFMANDGVEFTTNVLPFEDNLMIPVSLEVGANGIYTFSGEFEFDGDIILEDLFTGEFINLISGNIYSFTASTNDASERFILHFGSLTDISTIDESAISVYSNLKDIYVEVPANTQGDIFVYNMMGQNVASTKISGTLNKVSLDESAYYVVKVISNEQITSTKVFIK